MYKKLNSTGTLIQRTTTEARQLRSFSITLVLSFAHRRYSLRPRRTLGQYHQAPQFASRAFGAAGEMS